MKLFSERYGYTKPSDVIIREKITPEIQNAICSCYDKLKNRLFLDSGLNIFKILTNDIIIGGLL